MTIDILTIFPEMFESVLNASILGRARAHGLITIEATDIRPFSASKHKNTDDYPFGGGAGMLMAAQPIAAAIQAICEKRGVPCLDRTKPQQKASSGEIGDQSENLSKIAGNEAKAASVQTEFFLNSAEEPGLYSTASGQSEEQTPGDADGPEMTTVPVNAEGFAAADEQAVPDPSTPKVTRIYLSPRGVPLTQELARNLSQEDELILLCGHYEGVDQRVLDKYIDLEVSIGDYILTGGEVAAMALADCIARLVPGVLGSEESPEDESFSDAGLLEYPQYTRPRVFEGMEVPEVLLNGDHAKIAAWRRAQAIAVTAKRRPELLKIADLTPKEKEEFGLLQ